MPAGSTRGLNSNSAYPSQWGVKIPSDIASLRPLRQRLAQWTRTAGLSSAAVEDVVLASYEAVANGIEHAYRGRGGDVLLSAKCTDDHVIVTVTDYAVHGAVSVHRVPVAGDYS